MSSNSLPAKRCIRACDQCSQKKKKCSGEYPCQRCSTSKAQICTYTPRLNPGTSHVTQSGGHVGVFDIGSTSEVNVSPMQGTENIASPSQEASIATTPASTFATLYASSQTAQSTPYTTEQAVHDSTDTGASFEVGHPTVFYDDWFAGAEGVVPPRRQDH